MMKPIQISLAVATLAIMPFTPAAAKYRSPEIQVSSSTADEGVRTLAVSYADLNLRNEVGVAKLTSRVKSAVKQVCEPRNYTDLAQFGPTLTCKHSSMDRAQTQIANAVAQSAGGDRVAALESS
jgi:UrcA family protein